MSLMQRCLHVVVDAKCIPWMHLLSFDDVIDAHDVAKQSMPRMHDAYFFADIIDVNDVASNSEMAYSMLTVRMYLMWFAQSMVLMFSTLMMCMYLTLAV